MVRINGNIDKFDKLNEIKYKENIKIDGLKIDNNKKSWIQFKTQDSKIIRYIISINITTKTIVIDSDIPGDLKLIDSFEIEDDINFTHPKNRKLKVETGSTNTTIKLKELDKNADKLYNNYYVMYEGQVRMVKEYKNNILVLDFELQKVPLQDDIILLMPHFFNDYIILGIDFTKFLGMDFSDLIKKMGGSTNFQISTLTIIIICCICCIIISLSSSMLASNSPKPSQAPIIIQSAPQQQAPPPPPPPPSAALKSEVMSELLPYINPLFKKWNPFYKKWSPT